MDYCRHPFGFAMSERCSTDDFDVFHSPFVLHSSKKEMTGLYGVVFQVRGGSFFHGEHGSMDGGKSLEGISGEDQRDSRKQQFQRFKQSRKQPPRPQKEGKSLPREYGGLAGFCTNPEILGLYGCNGQEREEFYQQMSFPIKWYICL